jgi:hypothetical protein
MVSDIQAGDGKVDNLSLTELDLGLESNPQELPKKTFEIGERKPRGLDLKIRS